MDVQKADSSELMNKIVNLRSLMEKATDLPWQHELYNPMQCHVFKDGVFLANIVTDEFSPNTPFIISAMNMIPILLESTERLAAVEKHIKWISAEDCKPNVYIPVEIEFVRVGCNGTFYTTGQYEGPRSWTIMNMDDDQICYDPLPDIYVVTRWRALQGDID